MKDSLNTALTTLVQGLTQAFGATARATGSGASTLARGLWGARWVIATTAVAAGSAYLVWKHPPVQSVPRGEVGVRTNQFSGGTSEHAEGSVFVLPGLHELRRLPLRDQVYRPATGGAPFQSVEGLSFGMDIAVRYALDPAKVSSISRNLPTDINAEVVAPAVSGVIYKTFTRYTVREIFSTKRGDIQTALEAELKPRLAADGIVLKGVQMGKIDLPDDYRRGMDQLMAEELASAKMRYTLELKEKQVQQTALEAEAERVRREKAATAAANEQLIAARAQEEAMKHVLPFKQKQIEQRQLEAEAEKLASIKRAEGSAQARRVEAAGEADSRQKLADAEAYRLDRVGKVNTEQMAREGALITKHPLLIQKTMADKLSDKISVIIAPPSQGGFVAANLIGGANAARPAQAGRNGGHASQEEGSEGQEQQ